MVQLGVNIDHVATLRQARYRDLVLAEGPDSGEPDPVRAAHEAELGGADGITIHLREDRRHIVDRDVALLRRVVRIKLNLEMAATDEMVGVALDTRPETAMLVPEGRDEVTTEGGLDVAGQAARMRDVVRRLHDGGVLASAFIDPEVRQVEACAEAGFDICEIHTGPYASAWSQTGGDPLHVGGYAGAGGAKTPLSEALDAVERAGASAVTAGMRFNAGHALSYANVGPVAALKGLSELHIGHAIVSRAVFVGLRDAVRQMRAEIDRPART